jgi:hypothetical protein
VFWVHALHSPAADLHIANTTVHVGLIVAIKNPVLTLTPESWQRRVRCELDSNFVPLADMSLWLLRGTKWYEKPCDTALQWKLRGNMLFENGNYHGALAAYSNGLAQSPDAIDLLSNRANANLKLGAWRAAAADASAVLAIDPNHRKCALRLAVALSGSELYVECANAYMQAAKILHDSPSEVAVCMEGAERAALAREESVGEFKWDVLLKMACAPVRSSTFVSPLLCRGEQKTPLRPLGAWVAKQAIADGTLLMIERSIAVAPLMRDTLPVTMLLADSVMRETMFDERKRERVRQLAHPAAGSLTLERACAAHYFELNDAAGMGGTDKAGLFVEAAGFDHSCVPNCAVTVVAHILIVQAIARIDVGQPLLISVCPTDESLATRTAALSARGIECHCRRCEDESSDASYLALEKAVLHVDAKRLADSVYADKIGALALAVHRHSLARQSLLRHLSYVFAFVYLLLSFDSHSFFLGWWHR